MIAIQQKSKTKRVLKYLGVLVLSMIICGFADAAAHHWFTDPWFDFSHDWMMLYGAMAYRLITTWNYK